MAVAAARSAFASSRICALSVSPARAARMSGVAPLGTAAAALTMVSTSSCSAVGDLVAAPSVQDAACSSNSATWLG